VGFAQAEPPEVSGHGQTLVGRLALVDCQQHGHLLAAQPFSDGLIGGSEPLLTIDHHHGDGRFGHGQVGLLADFRQKFAVVVKDQTAGIDHPEGAISPEAFLVGAVPGDPGLVMNDGFAAAAEPVDEGGLAHIGAADNGDDWKRQKYLSQPNRGYS